MKVSPGKRKGLEAVSDSRGVIAAAAMDQRGSLKSAIAKDKGIDKKAVTPQMMAEFKEAVARVLTPHASAILLDPEYGLSAAKARARMPACCWPTKTAATTTRQPGPPARFARPLFRAPPRGRRRRLHQDSALLHAVRSRRNQRDQARLGRAHRRGMRAPRTCHFSWNSWATKKASTKRASNSRGRSPKSSPAAWRNSRKPQYGVDVLKVEVPVNMAFVKGARACKGESAYTREEAKEHFRKPRPWRKEAVHLSVRRREQRDFQRNAGTGRRSRREFLRRAVRPRHLERRHAHLRQAGPEGAGRLAQRPGREEHQERERAPDGGQAVVCILRRDVGRRAELNARPSRKQQGLQGRCTAPRVISRAMIGHWLMNA